MKRTLFSLLLSMGLLLTACGTGDTDPGGPSGGDTGGDTDLASQSYELGPQAYQEVAEDAEVTFSERADGNTDVTVDFGGAIDSGFAEHPAHIHMGEAGSDGSIVVTLNPVDDATGVSTTTVTKFDDAEDGTTGADVTYDDLIGYNGYVNVHLSAENIDVVFASANIGANVDVALPEVPSIAERVTSLAAAETDAEFTILLQALTDMKAAELTALLGDDAAGPFTVLAPTDAAFEALIEANADLSSAADLLALPNLADILSYHALPSVVVRSEVVAAAEGDESVQTAQGSTLSLSTDTEGNILMDGETAIAVDDDVAQSTNLTASNGVIHAIDTVLMPAASAEFTADLAGANEVPPVSTDATGTVTATLSGTTLSIEGTYSAGLEVAAPGAHIHGPASTTENAGILYNLNFENNGDAEGTLSAEIDLADDLVDGAPDDLTAEQVTEYLRNEQLYVNLHTAANQSGEIRGQLTPAEEGMGQ